MAVNIQTNHGKTWQNPYAASLTGFETIVYTASVTADVARIPFNTAWRMGYHFGPTLQNGKNGTTQLYLTLDNPDIALDPTQDSYVNWFTSTNLTAGQLQSMFTIGLFTVMKAVFTLSGAPANTLVIGSC